jgi:hypothetical protein
MSHPTISTLTARQNRIFHAEAGRAAKRLLQGGKKLRFTLDLRA